MRPVHAESFRVICAVTGGTGFIGSQLVHRLLREGCEVRVLTRNPPRNESTTRRLRFIVGDLCHAGTLRPLVAGADVLFHCAGQLSRQPQMRAVHVGGTDSLIRAAAEEIDTWVQLSSVGVYGRVRSGVVREASPPAPLGEYEITKHESDQMVLAAVDRGDFRGTILRPSNVFGRTMRNESLFQLVTMIDRGLFVFLGAEGASANYVHVDNVVEALWLAATRACPSGAIFNVSSYCTLETFVGHICQELDREPPHLRLPEFPVRLIAHALQTLGASLPLTPSRIDALTGRCRYATEAIERELGFTPVRAISSGVADLVEGWNARRSAIDTGR